MILSIGEILADMTDKEGKGEFIATAGGAPFNVAVNAKRAGANVGFIGRVGKDIIGKFLLNKSAKANLDRLDIQIDEVRNTTLAFVTLTDGERDFTFNRHDTADYNIDFNQIDFDSYKDLKILHLGSLMLSEKEGKAFALKVAKKVKKLGVKLSFDMNFRLDTYKDFLDAKKAYKPYVECADIIKFSDDELKMYTGLDGVEEGVKSLYREGSLFVVTLGSKGSYYYYNGLSGIVKTKAVKPVDTTGAGDAFFGTLLAGIEGKELNEKTIVEAMEKANVAGAENTQFTGALQL